MLDKVLVVKIGRRDGGNVTLEDWKMLKAEAESGEASDDQKCLLGFGETADKLIRRC